MTLGAVCVVPPGHRLVRRRSVPPADLHDEPCIALASGNRFRTKLNALLEARGVVPRVRVATPLAGTACALVMAGLGVAILDRLGAEDNLHGQIVIHPFLPRIAEDLILLSPASRHASAVAEASALALRHHR